MKWQGLKRGQRNLRRLERNLPREMRGALLEVASAFQKDLVRTIPYTGRRGYRQSFRGAVNLWKPKDFRVSKSPAVVVGPSPRAAMTNLWKVHEEGGAYRKPRSGKLQNPNNQAGGWNRNKRTGRWSKPRYLRQHTANYRKQAWLGKTYRKHAPRVSRRMRKVLGRSIRLSIRGGGR